MENSFKSNCILIQKIFTKYIIIKLQYNNQKALELLNHDFQEIMIVTPYDLAFINYIENILNHLSLQSQKIIIAIYINKQNYNHLPYSTSNFYFKKRKAIEEFINYFY